jgi:hypothetical protein
LKLGYAAEERGLDRAQFAVDENLNVRALAADGRRSSDLFAAVRSRGPSAFSERVMALSLRLS